MCGIAGYAGIALTPAEHEARLRRMCGAIRHRGPDDEGHYVGPEVGLGMRRLSIIDVAGGHQPIGNEDGSIQVVFNGEIYNHHSIRVRLERAGHSFRTRSDTETLVHLYEEDGLRMVDALRGMYGFALWDTRRGQLVLARDRLGIKPLYYWLGTQGLAFASELRCFLALDGFRGVIDREAIESYLLFGYIPDPASVFEGVRKLAPGHLLTWDKAGGVSERPYWTPVRPEIAIGEEEAVEETRRLLTEAVTSHLEAEVPLGAFLSGGLDSSTVAAIMAQTSSRRVRTFSIGFREAAYNEAPHARAVAAALGTDHTEFIVDPEADALIDGLVRAFDEPFADSSALPTYLVAQLARQSVTVALSGDGGDELFGGYTRYLELGRRRQLPHWCRTALSALGRSLPQGALGRNRLLDLGRTLQGRYAATVAYPRRVAEGGILRSDGEGPAASMDMLLQRWFEQGVGRDFMSQLMLVDLATYLPGDILTKVDRTTMAVSLEARVPLLDHPLVEFAVSLPSPLKIRLGTGKYIFRRSIEPWVPREVLERPKQGFALPIGRWLRRELAHRVSQLLRSDSPVYEYADPGRVQQIAAEHMRGRRDHSPLLWRLLVLHIWLNALRTGALAYPTENPFREMAP